MMVKQLSLKSSQFLLPVFLFMSPMYLISMDVEESNFQGTPIAILEAAYADAPDEVKTIVAHLKDPNYLNKPVFRSAFFIGETGTGKSTLAMAIAYKAGRDLKQFSATDFNGENRNNTALNLQGDLEDIASIASTGHPVVVVIDEINRLLENAESVHHDTDTTSAALWTFLDRQRGNHNFFLIGTMNRVDKLPPPIKSRIMMRCIKLLPIADPNKKTQFFLLHLLSPTCRLHEEVNETFLNEQWSQLPVAAGRYLEELALKVTIICAKDKVGCGPMVVNKQHISTAFEKLKQIYPEFKLDAKNETDEEMRERHHVETLAQQERHFGLNQQQQDLHFVQQQKIAFAIEKESSLTRGKAKEEAALDHIAVKQMKIYEDVMKESASYKLEKSRLWVENYLARNKK